MIRARFLSSMDDISPVLELRRRVLPADDGEAARDAHDDMCFYALSMDEDGSPTGTCRLYVDEDGRFRLGAFCVLPEARGKGFGDLIARLLLYHALELKAASVRCLCPTDAEGFLLRYGLRPEGETVLSWGVPCRMMSAPAERINLQGSCHGGSCADCKNPECGGRDK